MTDDRKAGIALIAGSVGGILTMAVHPTAGRSPTAEQMTHLVFASGAAHSLAMASFITMFLGACGLTRRIAAADRIAFAGIVTFGFACIAIMIAAAVSGFIVPNIMAHMVRDVPTAAPTWNIAIDAVFQFNQAFARLYSVGASLSIVLWSVSVLRNGGLGRGVAIYGCIVGPLVILGIAAGHLRLDIHGMAAIVLAHAVWFVVVGWQLRTPAGQSLP